VNQITHFSDLEELSPEELKQYIEDRLRLQILNPPIAHRSHEEPEDFIIEAIKRSKSNLFHASVHSCVITLLEIEWCKILSPNDDDSHFVSRLLIIVETFRFSEAQIIVNQMAANATILRNRPSIYSHDLYAQSLRTLAFIQEGPPGYVELWTAILRDRALSPYKSIAFQGLSACGIDYALIGVRHILEQSSETDTDQISTSMSEFFYQYREKGNLSQLIDIVIENIAELTISARQRFCEAMKLIPAVTSGRLPEIIQILMLVSHRPSLAKEYDRDVSYVYSSEEMRKADRSIHDIRELAKNPYLLQQMKIASRSMVGE
jgi:hypothetical protein